jgi:hypothetical protein
VFLRAESKGVNVNTFIRVTGVGLVRLDPREVGSFTFREAILTVKLELSSDYRVLAPAVHVKRGLSEDEGTSIRDTGVIEVRARLLKSSKDGSINTSGVNRNFNATKVSFIIGVTSTMPVSSEAIRNSSIKGTSILEKTTGINVSTTILSNSSRSAKSMDSVGESVNSIGIVEGLGTKNLEKKSIAN